MIDDNFAIFILTFGRPDNIKTYKTLDRFGYTGKKYLVCSTDDKKLDEYKSKYKDEVISFNKNDIEFDTADNFDDKRVVVYARNACFDIAKKLGITYFLQMDDDYTDFSYRFIALLKFYKSIPAKSIAISQNGDWIGGDQSGMAKKLTLKRKCMNSFFCSTERPFKFMGTINEDVNIYTRLGSVGDLFFTIPNVSLKQTDTQSNKGGMSDIYENSGTYIKSFYSVLFSPSSVKVSVLNTENARLHHRVTWNNAVPKILEEKYKK